MIITEAQKVKLQNYLHQTLSYRETYEEIYDHILSAIEFQPNDLSFEDAINNVIRNDFGGANNLLKIEKASKNALVKDSLNKYLQIFTNYFKFPLVGYTVAVGLMNYYVLSQVTLNAMAFEVVLMILTVVVPGIIVMLRLYNTGYILDTTRKSARDKMFENLGGGPVRLSLILNIWIYKTSIYSTWIAAHPFAIAITFLVCAIYNFALYRLYKDEFKVVVTK